MDWFRLASGLGFLATVVSLALHARGARPTQPVPSAADRPRSWLDRLAQAGFLLMALSLVVAGLTGFTSVCLFGSGSLSGWLLWAHFAAAPLFLLGLLLVVVLEAERHQFHLSGTSRRGGSGGAKAGAEAAAPDCVVVHSVQSPSTLEKVFFWLLAASGFSTGMSIALCMEAFFPAEDHHVLYAIHRVSAFLLTVAFLWFTYLRLRRGR